MEGIYFPVPYKTLLYPVYSKLRVASFVKILAIFTPSAESSRFKVKVKF